MNFEQILYNLVKTFEQVKGSSLTSIVDSQSCFLTLEIERSSLLNDNQENLLLSFPTSPEILPRSISHRHSNTVPSCHRKSNFGKLSNQEITNDSLTYKQTKNIQEQSILQPFTPSLLPVQPRKRIRAIDDPDECESQTSSMYDQS